MSFQGSLGCSWNSIAEGLIPTWIAAFILVM
jgi:hypothetical protein